MSKLKEEALFLEYFFKISTWCLRYGNGMKRDIPQSVNEITGYHLFRTCQNAIVAIQCLELLYIALFAWILGKNVLY